LLEFTIDEVASAYGVPATKIMEYLPPLGGSFPNASTSDQGEWLIPIGDVVAHLGFTIDEVASAYGVPRKIIVEFMNDYQFPNAHRGDNGYWLIPIGDLTFTGIGRGIPKTLRALLERSERINLLLELWPTIKTEGMKRAVIHKLAADQFSRMQGTQPETVRVGLEFVEPVQATVDLGVIENQPITPSASNLASDLAQLAALYSQGLLSAEEFSAAKQRIISEKPRQETAEPPALKPTPVLSDGENKRGTWGLDLSIKDTGTDAKTRQSIIKEKATPSASQTTSSKLHPPVPAKSPVGYWIAAMSKDFANFKGRARRAEFWWTALIHNVLIAVSSAISPAVGGFLCLIGAIPMLAVGIRRVHDQNYSGWWVLVPVGNVVIFLTDGDKGQNRFGPSPK